LRPKTSHSTSLIQSVSALRSLGYGDRVCMSMLSFGFLLSPISRNIFTSTANPKKREEHGSVMQIPQLLSDRTPVAAGEVGYLANAKVHAQVVLLFSVSTRTLRADLWSIRGTIHLENDDSWTNPPASPVTGRTRKKSFSNRTPVNKPTARPNITRLRQTIISGHGNGCQLHPKLASLCRFRATLNRYRSG
jgi:hypothetical protein